MLSLQTKFGISITYKNVIASAACLMFNSFN